MAITAGLFLVLHLFLASLGDHLFVREMAVQELAAGMVPANIVVRDRDGDYRSEDISFTSFVSVASRPKNAEVVMDITPEGLSPGKVAELQQLAEQGLFKDKIKVQDAMPFAPIILAGVVLTIISRGVFVVGLMNLLQR